MNDKTLKEKLEKLVELCAELDNEATRRYGTTGFLFYEAEGHFHIMSGDNILETGRNRNEFREFSSVGSTRMQCGAW